MSENTLPPVSLAIELDLQLPKGEQYFSKVIALSDYADKNVVISKYGSNPKKRIRSIKRELFRKKLKMAFTLDKHKKRNLAYKIAHLKSKLKDLKKRKVFKATDTLKSIFIFCSNMRK